jgi:pimeloyl-ACP methyl ester carboxylesterase
MSMSNAPPTTKGATIQRWAKRIGIGLGGSLLTLLVAGIVYEQIARHRAARDYPPRGQMVDIGGRKMHIDCRGQGAPVVIFEAGLGTTGSLSWDRVHDAAAQTTRACAYDRAGIMWSDPTPGEQDAEKVSDDLHATLKAAGIGGSLVMVGHSLGGPYIMTFVRKYGDTVKGLVFVDTSHPDQMKRMASTKPDKPSRGEWVRGLLIASSWSGLLRATKLDPGIPEVPGMSDRTRTVGAAYRLRSLAGMRKEVAAFDRIDAQAGKLRTLGDRPLVVLTATEPYPDEVLKATGMTRAEADRLQAIWKVLQADEASWSSRSRHELVPDSSHYIQDRRPDQVINAVREVVDMVRADDMQSTADRRGSE